MVVDDQASNRELVLRVLSGAGYLVKAAADPLEALALLGDRRCDLYVLDYWLPVMNGRKLADAIRRQHPDAKVLYVTALTSRLFRDAHTLREHEGLLEKPFTVQALRDAVSLLLFGRTHGPGAAGDT